MIKENILLVIFTLIHNRFSKKKKWANSVDVNIALKQNKKTQQQKLYRWKTMFDYSSFVIMRGIFEFLGRKQSHALLDALGFLLLNRKCIAEKLIYAWCNWLMYAWCNV